VHWQWFLFGHWQCSNRCIRIISKPFYSAGSSFGAFDTLARASLGLILKHRVSTWGVLELKLMVIGFLVTRDDLSWSLCRLRMSVD
jgi:hypothetical protein